MFVVVVRVCCCFCVFSSWYVCVWGCCLFVVLSACICFPECRLCYCVLLFCAGRRVLFVFCLFLLLMCYSILLLFFVLLVCFKVFKPRFVRTRFFFVISLLLFVVVVV